MECTANLVKTKMCPLNQRLWIDGNTSIAYGKLVGEPDGDLFSLTFFPEEMKQVLDVPLSEVSHFDVRSSKVDKFGALRGAVGKIDFKK